jgi:restriction endonuclease S subunit
MTGTTGRQRLSWQDLGRLSLFLPTISEQENIVSTIQALDSLCESTQASISRAKEFRRNLLSELLSGTHGIPSSYDSIVGLIG